MNCFAIAKANHVYSVVPARGWKIPVVFRIAHFFSLINISVDSTRCLLEAASFTLLWDFLSVNGLHRVLCIVS